ncbi:hypothetical protein LCGC14_0510770 [marine sediment metagenome]|uniref:Uncharacterized protein n=1 Tax=marine sediment metagenome TaxID=412755 RepID=A0A0F9S198_9ZZZZ
MFKLPLSNRNVAAPEEETPEDHNDDKARPADDNDNDNDDDRRDS